ncbi:hypothetical protein [Methanosarcina barkeri]|uniref:hypothetical protein n=1 Tax=Methanosarcina barkeri TaxID=2208 RepID=UPI00064E4013|nr:hypothetical protein [Methanosarcina barkeri]
MNKYERKGIMKSKIVICIFLLSITIASLGCSSQSDGSQESSQLNDTKNEIAGDLKDIEGTWMGNLTAPGWTDWTQRRRADCPYGSSKVS